MKIIMVCASISGGGAERVACNLASYFDKSGHEVAYFHWRASEAASYEISPGVRLVKSPSASTIGRLSALVRFLKSFDPAVIISFTDIPNILSAAAKKIARRSDITLLATVHNDLRARDMGAGLGLKGLVYRFAHKVSLQYANEIVAVSKGTAKTLSSYYKIAKNKISIIYNPAIASVEVGRLSADRLIGRELRFVAAGRLVEQKDYVTMLRALARAKMKVKFSVDIYGNGPLLPNLKKLCRQLDLTDSVRFCGFVKNIDKKMPNYDVFLLSSKWEGFGNVLVEALNAGLYVVSTDCPSGPSEILRNGEFGRLVPVSDYVLMADAIIEYAEEKNKSYENKDLYDHLLSFSYPVAGENYMRLLKKASGE